MRYIRYNKALFYSSTALSIVTEVRKISHPTHTPCGPKNITSYKNEANTDKIKINSMKEIEKENSEMEKIEKRILGLFKDKINSSLILCKIKCLNL